MPSVFSWLLPGARDQCERRKEHRCVGSSQRYREELLLESSTLSDITYRTQITCGYKYSFKALAQCSPSTIITSINETQTKHKAFPVDTAGLFICALAQQWRVCEFCRKGKLQACKNTRTAHPAPDHVSHQQVRLPTRRTTRCRLRLSARVHASFLKIWFRKKEDESPLRRSDICTSREFCTYSNWLKSRPCCVLTRPSTISEASRVGA